MNVNAVVSGQAGVALLVDGAKLASIHAGRSGEIVRRSLSEARFLLGDAGDLQFLENIELNEVIRRLELASTQMDALHTALILLDGSLPPETRQIAAEELQEFLEDDALARFVESVLFAHPLTRDSDLPGALAVCTACTEQTRGFLLRLGSLQGAITEVHLAWERIPTPVFGGEDRRQACSAAVREGLFRELVLCGEAQASSDQFLADPMLKSKMRREILLAWGAFLDPLLVRRREGLQTGEPDEPVAQSFAKSLMDRSERAESPRLYSRLHEKLDEAITRSLHRLGIPTRDEIRALTQRVEELTAKVEDLKPRATTAAEPVIVTPESLELVDRLTKNVS